MQPKSKLEGTGKQPCTIHGCAHTSVAGLRKGAGKCPYHFARGVWGEEHADRCYPEFKTDNQTRIANVANP